ncbi:ArsR family transcriptional regulator [Micromonospora sp. S4605]|nr:ArsR family transcriptional regulator [Micromonospora sp. S4605]
MTGERKTLEVRARMHAALSDPARLAIIDTLLVGDASPGELARSLDMPTNLTAHHLKVLQDSGLVVRHRSEGDRRRTYVRLVPEMLNDLLPAPTRTAPRVVFVCTHNSARSQLAAALWSHRSSVPAASAGTDPAPRVHPRALRTAERHGLVVAHPRPVHVADVVRSDDLVVAVCDNAHENLGNEAPHLHWSVADPAPADTDEAFEAAYRELADRIDRLAPAVRASDNT